MLLNFYVKEYLLSCLCFCFPFHIVNRRREHKLGHHTLAVIFTCAVSYAGLGKKSACFKGIYLLKQLTGRSICNVQSLWTDDSVKSVLHVCSRKVRLAQIRTT
jgi:hypothetical protein